MATDVRLVTESPAQSILIVHGPQADEIWLHIVCSDGTIYVFKASPDTVLDVYPNRFPYIIGASR